MPRLLKTPQKGKVSSKLLITPQKVVILGKSTLNILRFIFTWSKIIFGMSFGCANLLQVLPIWILAVVLFLKALQYLCSTYYNITNFVWRVLSYDFLHHNLLFYFTIFLKNYVELPRYFSKIRYNLREYTL